MKEIENCFSHLVGQKSAIAQRIKAWKAYAMGANPVSAFITGEAGKGKTALMRADLAAMKIAAEIRAKRDDSATPHPLFFASAGELRKDGQEWGKFMGDQLSPGSSFIYLDEFHELFAGVTVQTGKIVALIKGLCDPTRGDLRQVNFGDEGSVIRHASQVAFIVGTNYPKKLKDAEAIMSRLGVIELAPYTDDELVSIAIILAKKAGVHVAENTLATIARCGRGTARPVEKIIDALAREALLEGKKGVNRDDVVRVMLENELYPLGLSRNECAFLIQGCKGWISKTTLATMFAIEARAIADSAAFLAIRGLASVKGAAIATTQAGRDFLASLKKYKFNLPE